MTDHGVTPGASIDECAAVWLARMVSGHATDEDRAALSAWFDADGRHKGAYVRAMALWQMLDGAAQPPVEQPHTAPRRWTDPRVSRRRMLLGAGAIAASGAGLLLLPGYFHVERQILGTGKGQTRSFALSDGSHIMLDSGSRIEVAMSRGERNLTLVSGMGWFQVAKDKARPFIVTANGVRFVAVGTAFSVSREGPTRIVVTEGVVRMTMPRQAHAIDLRHNETATIDRAGALRLARLSDEDLAREMAWRDGSVGLNGETLGEAADSFNRYNRVQIVIADPALAGRRVVGWFSRNDPAGFAMAAATMLDAKMDQAGDTIRLMEK